MKRIAYPLILTLLGATHFTSEAVTANPRLGEAVMPDGSVVAVRLVGDEFGHYYQAENGYPVVPASDGFLYYARVGADGIITASGYRPGGADEKEFLATHPVAPIYEALARCTETPDKGRRMRRSVPRRASYPTTGSGRGLVVLVDYQDVKFQSPTANEDFQEMLNQPGYSKYGATGSAADWFKDNSSGLFTPSFDVYGPITLANDMAYYGKNDSRGEDIRPEMMAVEACQQLDDIIDFNDYDLDGDGYIDNIFIFYAGYGENLGYEVSSDAVWPHSWDLEEATTIPFIFDGVRLNHYACTNERDLDDVMDGIGTFCHEFSHVLGLPDLYSTNYSNAFTPGEWSVMDCGNYLNNSRTPPFYTAYERYFLGWLTPRKLTKAANVKLDRIGTNNACMIPTAKENEYFLLENRQKQDWDAYIPYHGMLIWHIDYNETRWELNTVNNSQAHQYVDIEEADGIASTGSIEGDCFPGTANVTSFTDDTYPNMLSWDGSRQEMPITDIRESNGYIYFKICGGLDEVSPVTAKEASEIGIDRFTASWEEGDYGCQYFLNVFTTLTNDDGKSQIEYVKGFENLSVGEALECEVTGLQPSTLYHYTVTAYDPAAGQLSAPSNQVDVTTLDPTFDYLTPRILSVDEVSSDSFILSWTELEGTEEYMLDIFTKTFGEPESALIDFTGGISALPAGWSTQSNFTYGAEDYCGESIPSLRLNASAATISSGEYSEGIRSLSFWYKGVGTSDGDLLTVEAGVPDSKGNTVWSIVEEIPLSNGSTASTVSLTNLAENAEWPGYFSRVRIALRTEGKGAVAIDDIKIEYGGEVEKSYPAIEKGFSAGKATSFRIEGLAPSTIYWAAVSARSGELVSRMSPEVRIITLEGEASVDNAFAEDTFRIFRIGHTLNISGCDGETVRIYSIDGRMVKSCRVTEGCAALTLPAPGTYIATDGINTAKINFN